MTRVFIGYRFANDLGPLGASVSPSHLSQLHIGVIQLNDTNVLRVCCIMIMVSSATPS
jgi:hypothetical protein